MPLIKLEDYYPNYRETFGGDDIKSLDIYTEGGEKVGSVDDVLVDEREGRFRYIVADTGGWFAGKKVLLPIGLTRIDYTTKRVYVNGLSKNQVENLPEFTNNLAIDYDYEDRVRQGYSMGTTDVVGAADTSMASIPGGMGTIDTPSTLTPSMMGTAPIETTPATVGAIPDLTDYNYNYDQYGSMYNLNERNHQNLRLYEERLIADKRRVKTGEVAVGKHIETETATVSVPVERERVVIERTTPVDAGTPVSVGEADFREGEVARIEVYEETPDIRKETVVREEVTVKKVVDRDTVNAEETIRREELDVRTEGTSITDRPNVVTDRPNAL